MPRDITPEDIVILVDGRGALVDLDGPGLRSTHDYEILSDSGDPLQTGMFPFMSAELLGHPYYPPDDATEPPVHHFIHDLESFLLVLVWICLTREGPAKRRRDLSSTQQTEQLSGLQGIVNDLFEGEKNLMMRTKLHLIHTATRRRLVDVELLRYVSDFMAPLKDLIFEFLSLISIAYEDNRRDAQAVYEDALRLFDKHIRSLQKEDPSGLSKKPRENKE
ncbi:uncharacterized protein C8Q71DRAFT_897196 [Rhodofomes roseus]|uniref:Fungal-type protein kinase domain-containing protein n=1 Tax=Rhodofomes roseus TaxID=34475 RepID=A0ABQ8KKK6_9APHY|nr:uncharacterized protein C8Q71DRAFT_897196 [Rhodofomes roseus]KAH9838688.1 hypothetical protein C8Q71DRAFT_897196 [Rhodofomes roseus]